MRQINILFGLALLLSLTGCASEPAPQQSRPIVYVSIPPHAYFAERIGGELVEVEVLLEPGASPATFDPNPQQLAKLADSDLYLSAGLPFERQLVKRIESQYPAMTIVDLRAGIKALPPTAHTHDGVAHEEESDPHIWLDPVLAKMQAQKIGAALIRMMPESTTSLRENLMQLESELTALADSLALALAPVRGKSFWVFHPAYGYLGARYGLRQVAIESEGKEPSAQALARLVDEAQAENVMALFVQPQFSTKGADVIAEAVGCEVIVADPLAHDYFRNLHQIGSRLAAALSE